MSGARHKFNNIPTVKLIAHTKRLILTMARYRLIGGAFDDRSILFIAFEAAKKELAVRNISITDLE